MSVSTVFMSKFDLSNKVRVAKMEKYLGVKLVNSKWYFHDKEARLSGPYDTREKAVFVAERCLG